MKYLLIKGVAGMGNRILGLATGLLYAEITGRRPLVAWKDDAYSDDGSDTFHRYFDAPALGSRDEVPDTASFTPPVWEGVLDIALRSKKTHTPGDMLAEYRHTSVDLLRTDHEADVAVMWSTRERIPLLRPHLQGEHADLAPLPTDAILHTMLTKYLAPCPEIAEQVAEFRREHLAGPAVGVHVRYADKRARLRVIRRRLNRLLAEEPGLEVFLATDNAAVRDEFERDYGAVSRPHRYDEPGTALHNEPDRTHRFQDGFDALVDMYLLAGCDHLIGDGKSSFSRVAMLLSDAPRANLSDVQALRHRWHLPLKAIWRRAVPGPGAPLAVAVARFLTR